MAQSARNELSTTVGTSVSGLVRPLLRWMGALVVGALLSGAFVANAAPAGGKVTGTAACKDRVAKLPEGARFHVQLLDVSQGMIPAREIASHELVNVKKTPIQFTMMFDPRLIQENHSYAVVASIYKGDTLLYRTVEEYRVLTKGAGNEVDVMLSMTREPGAVPKPRLRPRKREKVAMLLDDVFWKS
ncbi:YbaY family lipoprotein [Biformimicrobium ophioploci]|nr:YbaY family lipoprotein [Microbulbifer sp. NKW57]